MHLWMSYECIYGFSSAHPTLCSIRCCIFYWAMRYEYGIKYLISHSCKYFCQRWNVLQHYKLLLLMLCIFNHKSTYPYITDVHINIFVSTVTSQSYMMNSNREEGMSKGISYSVFFFLLLLENPRCCATESGWKKRISKIRPELH